MNHRLTLLIVLAVTSICHLPAFSQSAGAAKANQDAYALYNAGNYAEAAVAYEKLVKDYPTDAVVTIANVQLGFSYYFVGEFDKAKEVIEKVLKDPAMPPELKPIAASFLPQILSSKAASLPSESPQRNASFQDAIKEYTNFLTQFPNAPQTESIVYGRALSNYQLGNFDETVKDLESNVQKFGSSPTVLDSQNLLALTLATQASKEVTKPQGADQPKAFALFNRSVGLLDDIVKKKTDLTLVNDAQFQLGEILFNMAAFSPEGERPALYQRAMQAYRQVAPTEQMVDLQKEKIALFPERRRQLILNRATPPQLAALDTQLEREQRKLAELRARPDQIPTAMLKMGEIYYNSSTPEKSQYNQARVVLNHVQQFLQNDTDRKRAQYFLTMTYALQSVLDKATANYDEFQTAHKGDPMAENLPIAIGNMFLSAPTPDPLKAIQYFDESLAIYPKGQLVNLTIVSKARAQVLLKQFPEAEKTFTDFLATNPAPDIAVGAQMGLADIYKSTTKTPQDWDKALAAYQQVVTKFPDKPQRIDAEFWIAVLTQQKGDSAAAIPLLQKFMSAHPDSPLNPNALYTLADAQIKTGATDAGIATLAELATKYKDSPPAPFTYFLRAKIYAGQQKVEEVNKLMRDFIAAYPKDEKVFFAYDQIAQNTIAAGDVAGALKVYSEFIESYPENPNAPASLLKVGNLASKQAENMGRYGALNTTEQAAWKALMDGSISANEQLLAKYPDSAELAAGLGSLLKTERLLVSAGLKTAPDVQTYFDALSQKATTDSSKSKIQFAIANYESEKSKDAALKRMNDAFQESVVYSPADMDFYGLLLIDTKQYDQAKKVFTKLATDYPIPAGQVPVQTQEAQAVSLFGLGKLAQESGQGAEAAKLFQQLKTLYAWSPKVLEADYGIAENDFKTGKFDDALAKLPGIIRAPNATADLRAKSMFLVGQIYVKKYEAASDPKQKADFLGAAIDNLAKINQLYPGTSVSAESLLVGGQLFEAQAAVATDAAFKQKQVKQAVLCYRDIVRDYSTSPFAAKAQERLTALGAK